MRRRKALKFTVRRDLRRVQDLNLHLSKPGLLDALCDLEAMGVWELLRTSRSGRPAEEVAGLANISLTRTRLILEQLITLSLVESRPAGRGRRLTTYRVTVPELRVSHDGMAPELIGKLLARWSESRAEYFNRALKDGISPDGPAASGFCGSGVERLTAEETARLKSLIHQIGVLLRTAARRDPPPGSPIDPKSGEALYAVLIRMQKLQSMPLPSPPISFTPGFAGTKDGVKRIDRSTLAPRERQVAEALAGGMGRPEIAKQLQLSVHTVTTMSKRVYKKLGIRNRAELVRVMMT
jgi:DNA-binding CsgD family transcriptional regulator